MSQNIATASVCIDMSNSVVLLVGAHFPITLALEGVDGGPFVVDARHRVARSLASAAEVGNKFVLVCRSKGGPPGLGLAKAWAPAGVLKRGHVGHL